MTIDTYPLLTPTLILLNPVDNSEKANFYDILIEDEDGNVTVVTDNTTPQGKLILAGNAIVNEASQLLQNEDAKNDYRNELRSLLQSPNAASEIANKLMAPMNNGSRV